MKQIRLFLCIVLLICMVSMLPITAAAADLCDFEPEHECSISLTLAEGKDKENVVAGAQVTIYLVAEISASDEDFAYIYSEPFTDCSLNLEDYRNQRFAEQLYTYVSDRKISGTTMTSDDAGRVVFTGLKTGMYLVAETETVTGYAAFEPFISCVPVADDTTWIYDVDASPKIDVQRTVAVTVSKIWNDAGKNRPESVEVRLLNNDEIYDTVVLSEKNLWKHTWSDLPYSENWTVKEINVPQGYVATYYQDGLTFTINNTEKLIQTGQLKWPVPVLASAGILLIIMGIVFKSAGRNRESDKNH